MTIKNNHKTGYMASQPHVKVWDANGFVFYNHTMTRRPFVFNLPRGRFSVNQPVTRLKKPVFYNKFRLPRPEYKNRKYPKRWKIEYKSNPNKATVDYYNHTITFDLRYLRCPRWEKDFIFSHELGHKLYSTEHYADLYAVNDMLRKGYNPSQILVAHGLSLSPRSQGRRNFMLNHFKSQKLWHS